MRIRITKVFHFEMAHALEGYDGACRHIHGHSYRLEVTVSGTPEKNSRSPKLGMVMDFSDIKAIVNREIVDVFDHALVVKQGYEKQLLCKEIDDEMKVVTTPYQPTSEMLICHYVDLIQDSLPDKIQLEQLRLYETVSSYAEWKREDQ